MIYQIHEDHGKHFALNHNEAKANNENGWKTVSKEEFYGIKEEEIPQALIDQYKEKFGKAPHHKMKLETIQGKLDG